MRCKDVNECFEEISAYFNGDDTGHFLLINTENYDVYQDILYRFQADCGKKCLYASDYIYPNGLPNIDQAVLSAKQNDNSVLVGISQAIMLNGVQALENLVRDLFSSSISGKTVVLLDHCESIINELKKTDLRLDRRFVLVDAATSLLPEITFVKEIVSSQGTSFSSIQSFLKQLEKISDSKISVNPNFIVKSEFSLHSFSGSMYKLNTPMSAFDTILKNYPNVGCSLEEKFGTDDQWNWLLENLRSYSSFVDLLNSSFGSVYGLSTHLDDDLLNENDKWLLWIGLKVVGEKTNQYLSSVIHKSKSLNDFNALIYLNLVEIPFQSPLFSRMYEERKSLLLGLDVSLPLIDQFCDALGKHEKNKIYYLTDLTEKEKFEFLQCLAIYDYSDLEIKIATERMSRFLGLYMRDFIFDFSNTILSESETDYRSLFTQYFKNYKFQKLKNRLSDKFINSVNEFAKIRPYNRLKSRNFFVSQTKRENTKMYFFDALGVEYLSFILARCEHYGMVVDLSIGRCNLPSITEKNKEFTQYFNDEDWTKIDALDEMKHHSTKYNYETCKYPLHLFEELEVIENAIKSAHSTLLQGHYSQVMFVSDHGASRLAVLYGQEIESSIVLDFSGKHSGRCCPCEEDPCLESAAHENGFAVLANYERFKGGRRANVEVHGGASLEEVLVPVICMRKRSRSIEIAFVEDELTLIPRKPLLLKIYSTACLKHPRLCINGSFYDGQLLEDKKHASFEVPSIKRSGTYTATVYDGVTNMSIDLTFVVKKMTQANNDFDF